MESDGPSKGQHKYGSGEFEEHCDFFLRHNKVALSTAELVAHWKRYFYQRYPNRSEALYKMLRFGAAFSYLQKHIGSFEDFAVEGEETGLVKRPLMHALWRYYGAIPDQHLRDEPETELIQTLAEESAGMDG